MQLLIVAILALWSTHAPADELCEPYERSLYRHWSDLDGDGVNTRHEILARDSIVPVGWHNNKVVSGYWVDPYTGFQSDKPNDFDIEHSYSLADAHYSGACFLSKSGKETFANDERLLFAAWRGSNRSKSAKNLVEWLPSDLSFINEYADMRRLAISEYDLKPSECETLALDYFEGMGSHFIRGIDLIKVSNWVTQHLHIFEHRCFQ